jgi:putative Mg2+ transporter-C (MgtC) family protein
VVIEARAARLPMAAVHHISINKKSIAMDAWWHEVWLTLQSEFADIGDAKQLTQITVRLLMAAVLGGILGFEREQKGKAAGVRTHMLVALGAALFVLVPQMSGAQADALSRVVQGVVAGIGFLGAGTILKNHEGDEGNVKGLTTAAGLWMTAAIGVSAGLGREATAVLSTLLALAVFSVMPRVVRLLERDEP